MENKIIEKLQNCIKIKNIILEIINIKEDNGICCIHVTDPWDPLQDVYPNIVIENDNEIQICRNSKYIKLIDYNFKFNCKTRINYISLDGEGSSRIVLNIKKTEEFTNK